MSISSTRDGIFRIQDKLGAHPMTVKGAAGTYFAVWAPNANFVSVIGDFNGWDKAANRLAPRESSGIWEGFIPGARARANVQVPHRLQRGGVSGGQGGPVRPAQQDAPRHGEHYLDAGVRVGGQELDGHAARAQFAESADEHL